MNEERTVRLVLTSLRTDCTVSFEPEGAEHQLPENHHFTVEISGVGSGVVEVAFQPTGIAIVAWDRAQTRAWDREGRALQV